jgi:hypothetical protein
MVYITNIFRINDSIYDSTVTEHKLGKNFGIIWVNTVILNWLNSMEQSPYWEADSHSASQEIPRLLCNTKVH